MRLHHSNSVRSVTAAQLVVVHTSANIPALLMNAARYHGNGIELMKGQDECTIASNDNA
jgi:hypothetical protein